MAKYVLRRLILLIPILLGVTLFAFLLVHLTGDPVGSILGQHVTPQLRAQLQKTLGLDDPLLIQYLRFLARLARGDLGRSVITRVPVSSELADFFPATIELALAAMLIAVMVGVPLGALAAYRHNSWVDLTTIIGSLVGVSMPIFWLGLMLSFLFALKLGWFPSSGRIDTHITLEPITNLYLVDSLLRGNLQALTSALRHIFLPALALSTIPTAFIARMTRSAMLDVLGEDYIRTARAKGLRERLVVTRHALRNALLPVVTVIGLQTGSLLAGAILTETIFAWPGIGRWTVTGILARDFPVVQTGVLVFALIFVFINLIVDLSYAWIDPRIRYE